MVCFPMARPFRIEYPDALPCHLRGNAEADIQERYGQTVFLDLLGFVLDRFNGSVSLIV
jgi:hypothetical protein